MVRLKGAAPSLLTYCTLIIFLYFFVVRPLFHRIQSKSNPEPPSQSNPEPPPIQKDLLDEMDIDCELVKNGTKPHIPFRTPIMRTLEDRLLYAADRCQMLKSMYKFNDQPLSEEESEFSLAYGMLVYKELPQVLFMLSSIYHPQNEYCLAVGENSEVLFQNLLKELANCFPNVHFMKRPPIKWGSHEIINSAYECLEFLSQSKSKWKYFQYLSGVDVPLKTNLEMVQILKELNGTANVEIKNYQWQRLKGKNYTSAPLPLFKSSLSAVIPREAANELASSLMPRNILEFLENTGIADEGFWGTLFGNKKLFNIPGSLDFKEYIDYRDTQNLTWPTDGWKYYISRDQTWTKTQCHNYMTSGSCVYGIADVPRLLNSTALVAHKFYLKSEPEAYFCILKEIRRRSLSPDPNFSAKKYSELPTVELARGLKYSELTHKNWML